jgi:hypothetical protein
MKSSISKIVVPDADLEGSPVWEVLSHALDDLVKNDDLVETTARSCIVGLMARRLLEAGLISPTALEPSKMSHRPGDVHKQE